MCPKRVAELDAPRAASIDHGWTVPPGFDIDAVRQCLGQLRRVLAVRGDICACAHLTSDSVANPGAAPTCRIRNSLSGTDVSDPK